MLSAGAALIGLIVGAVAATVVLVAWSRSRVSVARGERERLLADARREAEAVRREAQVDAREQAVALRSEIESEVQDRRVEIAKIEERVLQKELEVDASLTELERREQGLGDREVHIKALQEELRDAQRDALACAREDLGPDGPRGTPAAARALEGPRAPRARARSAADGGGGAIRCTSPRTRPRRGLAPARRGEPHCRGDGDGRRARVGRSQGKDHRPGGAGTSVRSST